MSDVTFKAPPLVEVSFGVAFKRLQEFKTGHFGLYWSRIAGEFPQTDDKPAVISSSEAQTQEELQSVLRLPRVWFVHRGKELLLQLQSNRFYLNWRNEDPSRAYPRFSALAPQFEHHYAGLERFLEETGHGRLNIVSGELSYMNILRGRGMWSRLTDAGVMFKPFESAQVVQGEPEVLQWQALHNMDGMKVLVDAKTGTDKQTEERVVQVEIKAMSLESSALQSSRDLMTWFGQANEAIAQIFLQVTTERAQHEVWNRVS